MSPPHVFVSQKVWLELGLEERVRIQCCYWQYTYMSTNLDLQFRSISWRFKSSLEQTFRYPLVTTHDLQAQMKHQSRGITAVTKIISPELGFDAYFSFQKINPAIFSHSFPNISSLNEKKVSMLLRKIQESQMHWKRVTSEMTWLPIPAGMDFQ